MYKVVVSSHHEKAKYFRQHCCNVLFSHVRHRRKNKMEEDHQQTIIGIEREFQLAITDCDNHVRTFQYENLGLQGEIQVCYYVATTSQKRRSHLGTSCDVSATC